MRIYIPTKGRLSKQLTLSNLPRTLRERTTIVCPENEAIWHKRSWMTSEVMVQPDPKMGISEKRKWIVDTTDHEKIVMLDDDLRFAVRRDDDNGKFRSAKDEDVIKAFAELEAILDAEIPHAGFAARGGGIGEAAKQGGWQQAKRQMYVLGYHVPTVREHAVFGRLSTHEDMDVTLQLLTKGFPNMINFTFVVDQKFGNPGGCTEERTVSINNDDSLELARLHPGFVRATQKDYAGSTPRVEVVCSWVKALEHGLSNGK
jgi:hypothetical protein